MKRRPKRGNSKKLKIMAKKGVLRITGNTAPKTGEKAFYKVTEWYPDTPANERNESLITW